MRKIKLNASSAIPLCDVNNGALIFAKRDGKLCGVVQKEGTSGWILKIGVDAGCNGYHLTREDLLRSCKKDFGYTFVIE